MKRFSLLAFIGIVSSSLLAGCPIYSDDEGDGGPPSTCDQNDCENPRVCFSSADCGINETCGQDDQCHSGDCTIWGCTSGSSCVIGADLTASCLPGTGGSSSSGGGGSSSSSSSSGGSTSSSSSSSSGGVVVYCGNPDDCAAGETCAPDGTCQAGTCDMIGCIFGYACGANGCVPANPAACGADGDCAILGAGWACVSGICTAPVDQCSDQTQCPSAHKCVSGKCITSCTNSVECGSGYNCHPVFGVCTVPAGPCTITNDCGSADKVCVDGACVPRSQAGSCPPGEVWVENGCIPSQSASFVCVQDGVQDVCASGSICLHHNCYISCADPNGNVCDNLASFNVCKMVTTMSGNHQVCGSNDNLGNECGPTPGLDCAPGKICIDGFCK